MVIKMKNKTGTYIVSILIALAVGGLSAFFTRNNMDIYSTINRPPLSPPSVVFPIVWAILFILMGISAAIVYGKAEENAVQREAVEGALLVYAFSLILKAIPHKDRLQTLHAICLHLFRHLAQKSLIIREYDCKIFIQSDEKSDSASYAQSLRGIALIFSGT